MSSTQAKRKVEKKSAPTKFKKAPGAPRRFKSAFIFFSTQKHKEIRLGLGKAGAKEKTTNVAKMVSEAWKSLEGEEREFWEDKARRDKERYEMEKSMYNGPWKVPATKAPKDPNAPKRPMSAFLSYSNSKRSEVKKSHPNLSNAEVSRILASMWKEATDDEKQSFVDHEFKLRQEYKLRIAEWRANAEEEKVSQRAHREDAALKTLEAQKQQIANGEGVAHSPMTQVPLGAHSAPPGSLTNFLSVAQDEVNDAGASLESWGQASAAAAGGPSPYGGAYSGNLNSAALYGNSYNPYMTSASANLAHQNAAYGQGGAYGAGAGADASFLYSNYQQQQEAAYNARYRHYQQQQQHQGHDEGQEYGGEYPNIFDGRY